MRELAGQDESHFETLDLRRDVLQSDEAQKIIAAQLPDGTWGRSLSKTEFAILRLCEFGLERTRPVDECVQKALMPSLGAPTPNKMWEGGRATRDELLHVIGRATSETNDLVTVVLETVLTEWELFLSAPDSKKEWPTFAAYAALCSHRWDDEEYERVSGIVLKVLKHLEDNEPREVNAFRIHDKAFYLSHPEQLLYELELSARLGLTHSCNATRWMFEEIESRQDADGWVRFEGGRNESVLPWYFPLADPARPEVDWTFRSALVFKLLEFDF